MCISVQDIIEFLCPKKRGVLIFERVLILGEIGYVYYVHLNLFTQLAAIRTMLKDGLVDTNEGAPWSQLSPNMLQDMHPHALLGVL